MCRPSAAECALFLSHVLGFTEAAARMSVGLQSKVKQRHALQAKMFSQIPPDVVTEDAGAYEIFCRIAS